MKAFTLFIWLPLCSNFEIVPDSSACRLLQSGNNETLHPSTWNLIHHLTQDCEYDKLKPPPTLDHQPLKVYIRVFFYYLRSFEAHNLQFTVHMLLQCRFSDPRLSFDPAVQNLTEIVGTKRVSDMIWTPHVYLYNERESHIMGPEDGDVMVHIHHDGTVLFTKRLKGTLFCWMKLGKFPFDSQQCTVIIESWTYNMTYLMLEWEEISPISGRDKLTLTEFSLTTPPVPTVNKDEFGFDKGYNGAHFQGNYSSLVVTFNLQREFGFYVYDFFIPSVILVMMSWISFWFSPDALPARIMLGTSTMVTFIILSGQTGDNLPRASYIKATEIWFLGVTAFIFGSLVEFMIVNMLWRRGRKRLRNGKRPFEKTSTRRTWPINSAKRKFRTNSYRKSPSSYTLHKTKSMLEEQDTPIGSSKEMAITIDKNCRVFFPISFYTFICFYWIYVS